MTPLDENPIYEQQQAARLRIAEAEQERRYFWVMLAVLAGVLAIGILIGQYWGG